MEAAEKLDSVSVFGPTRHVEGADGFRWKSAGFFVAGFLGRRGGLQNWERTA